jgi:hypothetical protein
MSETQTMSQALSEMAGAVVDEPLHAVQWFHPGPPWNSGPSGWRRFARTLAGRGRGDDGSAQSVLIVTETRVIVYTAGTATREFALQDLIGAWPRPQVSATAERIESYVRLTLHTPDGELVADLPERERATMKVSRALRAH